MKKFLITLLVMISLFVLWRLISKKEVQELPINVIATVPVNNDVFVDEKSEVVFTLSRIISIKEGNKLKIEIFPSIKNEVVYLGNKVRISPEGEFSLNTNYEIKIIYNEKLIYTLNFKTNPFSQAQIQDEGGKQTQLDLDFNKTYEEFNINYPWYREIPIESTDYIIVYDFERESFKIIMKKKILSEAERQSIIRNAIYDIEKIGVKTPINNYYLQEIQ